jgi:hypothetical protein
VQAFSCAAGPLTAWRRGERRFGIDDDVEVKMRPAATVFFVDRTTNFAGVNFFAGLRSNPFKSRKKDQLCVKRKHIPPLYFVVFTQQRCRFHTSLNFSRKIHCASIPRVLSAPAPGVTA